MGNFWQRLRQLPWRSLVIAAGLAIVVLAVFEVLLVAASQSSAIAPLLGLLFRPPLGLITLVAIAMGVGALAVVALERLDRFAINTGSLWALVLCLASVLLLKTLLPAPSLLSFGQFEIVGMMVGVFWRGRPYWRHFRRW
jgi:hypothetical protein